MEVLYLLNQVLSEKARELVNFDVDSIRQVVAGRHAHQPVLWVADPEQYEQRGRVLRDSVSPRLLAYSEEDKILYANDGCNSCIHALPADLKDMTKDELLTLAGNTRVRTELIEKMADLALSHS